MTEERRSYSVSDLALELQLPRTTINDWLKLYAPYLDGELRGKRRVYFDGTLRLLAEVAELRREGRSNFEVERELARRHGLHPEPAGEEPAAAPEEPGTPAEGALVAAPVSPLEQMTRHYEQLQQGLEKLEQQRRRAVARFFRGLLGLLLGLLLLGAFGVWALFRALAQAREREEANRRQLTELAGAYAAAAEQSRERGAQQQQQLETLNRNWGEARSAYQQELERLRRELGEQRREFAELLNQLSKDQSGQAERQRLEQKEEFARRQQQLLAELERSREAAAAETAAVRTELQNSHRQLEAQQATLKALEQELEQLRLRPEPSAQPAPQPAPPEQSAAPGSTPPAAAPAPSAGR